MAQSDPFSLVVPETDENISALCHELELPDGATCHICIASNEADDISCGIASRTYQIPIHYRLLETMVREPGRVVDLGAHIGTFTLYAAAAGHQVIAVEASRRNVALLTESVRRNGFDRVRVVHAAAWERPGSVEFTEFGLFGVVSNPTLCWPAMPVPAVTVDGLALEAGWSNVDFLKMDIEGSEAMALRGMSRALTRQDPPAIVFEGNGHTLHLFGETPSGVIEILERSGYRTWMIGDRTLVPVRSNDLQMSCLADYLSHKRSMAPIPGWKVRPPLEPEEQIELALVSSRHENSNVRAYIGRTLRQADARILSDPRIVDALVAMKNDPEPDVRVAASWSSRR